MKSAALHGLIGLVGKQISALKGIDTGKIYIDTDMAGLYPATVALVQVDGKDMAKMSTDGTISGAGVDVDKGVLTKTHMHYRSWAIYPTREQGIYYQSVIQLDYARTAALTWLRLMGNLDPAGFLKAYGLDPQFPASTRDEAYDIIKAEISKYSAGDLELKNMEHGFTGQTVYTPKHWRETTMGKAVAHHPVVDFKQILGTEGLSPVPFPQTRDSRPLAGIKIIELARVIAAPAAGAGLAALGADVISIQSPNIPNLGVCHDIESHARASTNLGTIGSVCQFDRRQESLLARSKRFGRQTASPRTPQRSGCHHPGLPVGFDGP